MDKIDFILLDRELRMVKAWESQLLRIPFEWRNKVSVLESELCVKACDDADCIVSPANSYARLDGSYDEAISNLLFPDHEDLCTEFVQSQLYQDWKGYQPVATCMLVPIYPQATFIRYIAHVPTMRIPEDVRHDTDIAYRCTWSLLNSLHLHNNKEKSVHQIKKVILTGFATGVGGVSMERAGYQMIQAMIDYRAALKNENQWTSFEWDQAHQHCNVARTTQIPTQ